MGWGDSGVTRLPTHWGSGSRRPALLGILHLRLRATWGLRSSDYFITHSAGRATFINLLNIILIGRLIAVNIISAAA